ncbi:MAG: hypothetical protein OSB62_02980 [Alphaproteobacteria bacterium]|nr:hypothetical protein [Alphaproteobacteria bacterium]
MSERDVPDYGELEKGQHEAYKKACEAVHARIDVMREHALKEEAKRLGEQAPLKDGEDFFFEVPHHAANRLFAERLKAMGFERSNLIRNDEFDRFYMPEGTDLDAVAQEYSEYFNAGEAPEPVIIPLGFLTPGRFADDWPPDN